MKPLGQIDNYKRKIMSEFDQNSSSYGEISTYSRPGVAIQASIEREVILKIVNNLDFDRGVDLGCGPGRYLRLIKNPSKMVGLDISNGMVYAAKRGVKEPDIVLADMDHTPFRDNSFALVYSIRAMKYLGNQRRFLREVKRICADNGCVLLYDIWNAGNVGYLIYEKWSRLMGLRQKYDFPREMHRMNHVSIKQMLELDEAFVVRVRGILFLPPSIYNHVASSNLLRIFVNLEKLLSLIPFSQHFGFSVLYVSRKHRLSRSPSS